MKTKKLLFLFIALCLSFVTLNVTAAVVKTVGTTGADFVNLKAAFDAINADTDGTVFAGDIELQIIDDVVEVENTLTTSNSHWTSLKIYPVGAARTISYSGEAEFLIELDGADNVTFDGRLHDASGALTGSDAISLSISSEIRKLMRLYNGASNNTIRYCDLYGKNHYGNVSLEIAVGLITFDAAETAGNDNNTISNNYFHSSNGPNGRPVQVVFTSTSTSTGNSIVNNHFEDFFKYRGVVISGNNHNVEISGNSFFNTDANSYHDSYNSTIIFIDGGQGHVVSGNYFGGNQPECDGLWNFLSATQHLFVIYMKTNSIEGVADPSNILVQNNTMKNISWKSDTGNPLFIPIRLQNVSNIEITTNTIVDNTIRTRGAPVGIWVQGASQVSVTKNFIHNVVNEAPVNGRFFGILSGDTPASVEIINNIISLGDAHETEKDYRGISDGGNSSVLFNTIYIYGDPTGGAQATYGYLGEAGPTIFQNNLVVNTRSNTNVATGTHYAVKFNAVPSTSTVDYNLYMADGTGGVLGAVDATDYADLAAWQTGSGQDVNSYEANPNLSVSSNPLDYKLASNYAGVSGTGVTEDYEGVSRSESTPYIGAFATKKISTNIAERSTSTIEVLQNAAGILIPLDKRSKVELYTSNGVLLDRAITDGAYIKRLDSGIYIIRVNDSVRKIIQ